MDQKANSRQIAAAVGIDGLMLDTEAGDGFVIIHRLAYLTFSSGIPSAVATPLP